MFLQQGIAEVLNRGFLEATVFQNKDINKLLLFLILALFEYLYEIDNNKSNTHASQIMYRRGIFQFYPFFFFPPEKCFLEPSGKY